MHKLILVAFWITNENGREYYRWKQQVQKMPVNKRRNYINVAAEKPLTSNFTVVCLQRAKWRIHWQKKTPESMLQTSKLAQTIHFPFLGSSYNKNEDKKCEREICQQWQNEEKDHREMIFLCKCSPVEPASPSWSWSWKIRVNIPTKHSTDPTRSLS